MALAKGDGPQDGIQHAVEVFGNVLREEAENQVTVFLKQTVLAAVAPVRDGISQVLRAIEFDGNAQLAAEQVDFHPAPTVERDRQFRVQQEQPARYLMIRNFLRHRDGLAPRETGLADS